MVPAPRANPWRSDRATAGRTEGPAWLTVSWVLGQVGQRRGAAQTQYRQFVADGVRQPARPWEQLVGQVYLGGEAFIRRVLRHGVPRAADSEIPRRRQREPCWLAPEMALQRVAHGYGVDVRALGRPKCQPSEARQVALYGLRRWAGEALPAIARRMGVSYSAVSRRVSAVARWQGEERRFRERLARLSDGKVKT